MYLILSVTGPLLLEDKRKILAFRRWDSEPDEKVNNILMIESGELPPILEDFLSKHIDEVTVLVVENEALAQCLKTVFPEIEVKVEPGHEVFKDFRTNLEEYLRMLKISYAQYKNELYSVACTITRHKVRKAAEKRDLFIAQAINALDDVNKTINLFASRLREWYSLHFPELNEIVEEHETYARLVNDLGDRSNFTKEKLSALEISDEIFEKLVEAAEKSMGAEVTEFDLEAIRGISDIIIRLYGLRRKLEKYIDEAMLEVAPNIRGLVGSLLGARLISLAGGLSKLAILPASTIQVLGAEKALFRALRTGGKPPKHGVIFQYPDIYRSPRWQRGKIARALAAKLAIAARIDAFTGEYKADELKEELEARIKEIKELYAKPPKRKVEVKRERKGKGFRRKGKKKHRSR